MANKFLNGIEVSSSAVVDGGSLSTGSTILDIQGSQGQLFSVTNSLVGDLFSVSDISGVPILNVNSSGLVTVDGNISLGDSDKMQFGASQDLKIYHDGSNSYIDDASGTGSLYINTNAFRLVSANKGENMIRAFEDGQVILSYNNLDRISTTSAGVAVNGFIDITDVTATALRWYDGTTFRGGLGLDSWAHSGSDEDITMYIAGDSSFHVSTNNVKRLEIDSSGATFAGDVGLGGTGLYTNTASLNIDGTGLAIKNDTAGSSNNWSIIKNTSTSSGSNIVFVTGAGTSLTLNHDVSATFAGNIVMSTNATVDGVDISALPTSFAPTNAEQNVQSNWTETTTTSDAFILNKPTFIGTNTGDQVTFDSTSDLTSPSASTGTWTNGTATDWGTPKIGTSLARFNDGTGTISFTVPTGIKTAYISQLTWSSGGYMDVYGVQADGDEVFLRRINTKQTIENSSEGNPNQHDGTTIAFAGHIGDFPTIMLHNKVGRFHLTGLGFSKSELAASDGTGIVNYSQLTGTVPTWNQNTAGNAATVTTNANLTGGVTSVGNAATVVTNANLTGHITSVGNAAVLGSFTTAQLNAAISDGSINIDQTLPTDFVSAASGGTFSGNIDASNLSGTNTGDNSANTNSSLFIDRGALDLTSASGGNNGLPFDNAHTETKISENGMRTLTYTGASAFMYTFANGGSASVVQYGAHYNGNDFYMRTRTDSSTWNNWRKLYHDNNIPTWNQNTTGNAATASSATIASKVTINSGFSGTYPMLVEVESSGIIYNNTNVTYNGSSSTLTSPNFSGNLTGNVTGNVTGSAGSVAWGNITSRPYILNSIVTSATTTTTVANVLHATYTAAFFDFVIKNGTNVRAGIVYACHDGTNVEYAETSTVDLGDTSDVTLSVEISGTNMRLRATTTSSTWTIKSLIRAI